MKNNKDNSYEGRLPAPKVMPAIGQAINHLYSLIKPTLGWLRVVLALMVVDTHYGFFGSAFNYLSRNYTHGQFGFCGDGVIAVFGFFIISGFLVSEILEKKYPSNTFNDFLHFCASRYLRIFPLYVAVFLISIMLIFILTSSLPSTKSLVANITLIPFGVLSFFPSEQHATLTIGPAWTLALDLVFYPIGYLVFKNRLLFKVLFILLVVQFFIAWWLAPVSPGTSVYDTNSWWYVNFSTTIQPNLLAFMAGMLSSMYLKKFTFSPTIAACAVAILLWVCYFPLGWSYFAVNIMAIVAFSVIVKYLAAQGFSRHESLLGSFTYSLYLVHTIPFILDRDLLSYGVLVHIYLLMASVTIAFVIAVYFEEGLVEKKRKTWLASWRSNFT
jgi:peptidoglycan/LPS O-acetylase OafA/YrhL